MDNSQQDNSNIANLLPRFAANIVDGFLIFITVGLIGQVIGILINLAIGAALTSTGAAAGVTVGSAIGSLIHLIGSFGYFAYFLPKDGTTPGLKYLGLKITKEDGSLLTTGESLVRTLVFSLISFINLIAILVTQKRQGVHDMVYNTICVKVDEQESRAKWVVGAWCGCSCLSIIGWFLFAAVIISAISGGADISSFTQ